jgi:hypothetical protein
MRERLTNGRTEHVAVSDVFENFIDFSRWYELIHKKIAIFCAKKRRSSPRAESANGMSAVAQFAIVIISLAAIGQH